jgi:hypothetical protein
MSAKNNACASIILACQGGERHGIEDSKRVVPPSSRQPSVAPDLTIIPPHMAYTPEEAIRPVAHHACGPSAYFRPLLCMAKEHPQLSSMTAIPAQSLISPPSYGHVALSRDQVYLGCLIGPTRNNVARLPNVTMTPDGPVDRLGRHIDRLLSHCVRAASDNGFLCREVAGMTAAISVTVLCPRLLQRACEYLCRCALQSENCDYGHG